MITNIIKDAIHLGWDLLWPKSFLNKNISIGIFSTCLFLVAMFIWYSAAQKFHWDESWIYYRKEFLLRDKKYPEYFGYFLEVFIVAIFILKAIKDKQKHWFYWSAIFIIVAFDDSLQIHELFGSLGYSFYGYNKDIGELVGFAFQGIFVMAFWAAAFQISPKTRQDNVEFLIFSFYFGLLLFFGVIVDGLMDVIIQYWPLPVTITSLAEDGSELICTGLFAISTFNLLNLREMPLPSITQEYAWK